MSLKSHGCVTCTVLLFLFLTSIVSDARSGDWPMRGRSNDRNSVSLEPSPAIKLIKPNHRGRNVAIRWEATLGHDSCGEPAVSDGLVWIGTNNSQPRDLEQTMDASVLMCFRESDGEFLYQYVSPRLQIHPSIPAWHRFDWPITSLSSTPLIENDRLWFCTNRSEVICLNIGPLKRNTGTATVAWKIDMIKEFSVVPRGIHIGYHSVRCSIASYKDSIYVTTGNTNTTKSAEGTVPPGLICLSKDDGSLRWRADSPPSKVQSAQCGNPLVAEFDGVAQVIIGDADEYLRSYSAETGQEIWKFNLHSNGIKKRDPTNERTHVLLPVAYEGRIYFAVGVDADFCGGQGMLCCVDPRLKGDISEFVTDSTGARIRNTNSGLIWSYLGGLNESGNKEMIMHETIASPTIHDGILVIPDAEGTIHCLDCHNGKLLWTHTTDIDTPGSALIAGGKIYVGTNTGKVLVFELSRKQSLIETMKVSSSMIETGLVLANDTLYVLCSDHLYAISK